MALTPAQRLPSRDRQLVSIKTKYDTMTRRLDSLQSVFNEWSTNFDSKDKRKSLGLRGDQAGGPEGAFGDAQPNGGHPRPSSAPALESAYPGGKATSRAWEEARPATAGPTVASQRTADIATSPMPPAAIPSDVRSAWRSLSPGPPKAGALPLSPLRDVSPAKDASPPPSPLEKLLHKLDSISPQSRLRARQQQRRSNSSPERPASTATTYGTAAAFYSKQRAPTVSQYPTSPEPRRKRVRAARPSFCISSADLLNSEPPTSASPSSGAWQPRDSKRHSGFGTTATSGYTTTADNPLRGSTSYTNPTFAPHGVHGEGPTSLAAVEDVDLPIRVPGHEFNTSSAPSSSSYVAHNIAAPQAWHPQPPSASSWHQAGPYAPPAAGYDGKPDARFSVQLPPAAVAVPSGMPPVALEQYTAALHRQYAAMQESSLQQLQREFRASLAQLQDAHQQQMTAMSQALQAAMHPPGW